MIILCNNKKLKIKHKNSDYGGVFVYFIFQNEGRGSGLSDLFVDSPNFLLKNIGSCDLKADSMHAFIRFTLYSIFIVFSTLPLHDQTTHQICISSSWSYNAYASNVHLHLYGAISGQLDSTKSFTFDSSIVKLSTTDKSCLVLLANGDLFKVCPFSGTKIQLNFIAVDRTGSNDSLRRRAGPVFTEDVQLGDNAAIEPVSTDVVTDITSCETFSVALTSANCLYTIPSKIYTFPRHQRVVKMCGGAEHVMILTANGDLYAFGMSS